MSLLKALLKYQSQYVKRQKTKITCKWFSLAQFGMEMKIIDFTYM